MSESATHGNTTTRYRAIAIACLMAVCVLLMSVDSIARRVFGATTEGPVYEAIYWAGLVGTIVLCIAMLRGIALAVRRVSEASSG